MARDRLIRIPTGFGKTAGVVAVLPLAPIHSAPLRTSELRSAGAAQPPGTRRFTWWRPPEACSPGRSTAPLPRRAAPPTFALLSVPADTRRPATLTHLGQGAAWVSETLFVPPRFLRRGGQYDLRGQVAAELAWRGLPAPASVEVEGRAGWVTPEAWFEAPDAHPRWRHFRFARQQQGRGPPQRAAVGLRLTFDREVEGPVCLGYGSHFGLGQFVPVGAG